MRFSRTGLRAARVKIECGTVACRRGVSLRELLTCVCVGCLPLLFVVFPQGARLSDSVEVDEQSASASALRWAPLYDIVLCGDSERVLVRSYTATLYECTDHFSATLCAVENGYEGREPFRIAPDGITAAEWIPDGCLIRRAGLERVIPTREVVRTSRLAFSPDSRLLALAVSSHDIAVWELDGFREVARYRARGVLRRFVFTGDSRALLIAEFSDLEHWSFDGPPQRVGSSREQIFDLTASQCGRYAATAGFRGELVVWDLESRTQLWSVIDSGNKMSAAVAISPTAEFVCVGGYGTAVDVYMLNTGERVQQLSGHAGPVNDLAFAPRSGRLFSSSSDGKLRVWDVQAGTELAVFENPDECLSDDSQGD